MKFKIMAEYVQLDEYETEDQSECGEDNVLVDEDERCIDLEEFWRKKRTHHPRITLRLLITRNYA